VTIWKTFYEFINTSVVRRTFLSFVRHSGLDPESSIFEGIRGFIQIMSLEFM